MYPTAVLRYTVSQNGKHQVHPLNWYVDSVGLDVSFPFFIKWVKTQISSICYNDNFSWERFIGSQTNERRKNICKIVEYVRVVKMIK